MDLEKLAGRSRSTLLVVSFVGIVTVIIGVLLTLAVMREAANHPGANWVTGLGETGGPLALAAIGLLLACVPWGMMAVLNMLTRIGVDSRYRGEQLLGTLEGHRQSLEAIRETVLLSDAAKQIAYREKDLSALRTAIREDMDKGDFEAATMLVSAMEERFGYLAEANHFRDQIDETSRAAIDARVRDTTERVEVLMQKHDWPLALRESERLAKQFPSHDDARRLPSRVHDARDAHKRELLKEWKDAVAGDDVNRSIDLLRQLDQYLSPSEAEAYKESARDVFKKRLQQLGSQFALQVHDKHWNEALRLGRQIVDEFPNTRMAGEVRERLPILQEKAQQPVAV